MFTRQIRPFFALFLFTVNDSVSGLQDDSVLVLTENNFEESVRSNQFLLVEFYAPWCGHCRQFAPIYAAAAERLRANSPPVPLAKVDATSETRLAEKYGIRGYPTLRLFLDGSAEEYTGGRTENDIVAWVLKKTVQPCLRLEETEEAERFEADAEFAVIGAFDSSIPDAFLVVARQTNDVAFACTTSMEIARRYGMKVPSAMMLFPHDEKRAAFLGDLHVASEIVDFVKTYRYARVSTFSGDLAAQMFGDGRPILFLFRDENEKGREAEHEIAAVASKMNRRMLVSVAGSSDPMDQRLMDYLGVEPEELPTVRIITSPSKRMLKYKFFGMLDAASLTQFAHDFEAGRLRPHLKSEAPPASNTGSILTVVGSTFDSLVRHTHNDVLVEFYAPWCGHCKKFEAVYKEVARRLEPVKTLQIVKIDATANDVEGIDVQDFPTIKLFRSGSKENPLDYDGDRDVHSVLSWLKETVTHRFSQSDLRSEL